MDPSPLSAALTDLLDPLLQSAVVALVGLIMGLVFKLLQRVGLSLSAEMQAQMLTYAQQQALAIAEAQAAIAAKKIHGIVLSSEEKLELLVAQILTKFPRISSAEAHTIAKAALPLVGQGALVAAQGTLEALKTRE